MKFDFLYWAQFSFVAYLATNISFTRCTNIF